MKKLGTTLFCFVLLSTCLLAQGQEITFEKSRFIMNGSKIKFNEAAAHFEKTSMAALDQFTRGKKNFKKRDFLTVGGVGLLAAAFFVEDKYATPVLLGSIACNGLALMFHFKAAKPFKNAASIYNQINGYSSVPDYSLNIGISPNGNAGIALKF